jgi:nucleoid-associated protein YgaU
MLVLISRLSYRYAGGEPGDIHYDITLRQWREVRVRSLTAAAEGGAPAPESLRPRPDTRPAPKVYTVRPGDTLYGIAKLELGNGARWREIYDLNKSVIGPDPNLILPGQRLVMPT